jgi:predicted DNA-binding protein YlxM (UPF0122 family)|tara:strand:+ start:178 stop:414 length:237 start_codon:yes stop_codon:yes gene_type:complete
MAQKKKYKDIGKKDIINVISQTIQKVEAIEMTLNLLVMFVDKDEKFGDFMKEKLGGKDEVQGDENSDRNGDTTRDNKD